MNELKRKFYYLLNVVRWKVCLTIGDFVTNVIGKYSYKEADKAKIKMSKYRG